MSKKVLFVMVCSLLSGCSYVNKQVGLPDDNFIEESAEEVLKKNTGLKLDFTPGSPEE